MLSLAILLAVPGPAMGSDPGRPEGPVGDGDGVLDGHRATAKWTYMVYMSADNNLEDEAILNVNQMEVVGSTPDIDIVIQLDRTPGYDETNGNWNGTRRFHITQDADIDTIGSTEVDDLGEVDMGDGATLRDFVVWAVTSYPADRYYLDVWGHGGGWRDGTCNDYTSNTAIDTKELGDALGEAEAITNVTLDGIGFDQCLMAQLEVFYEIKRHADVLVGAETLIPADGYNYTRVMTHLAADPDMDAAELGDLLVAAFFDEYGHENERAHSALDAEELDARLAPSVTWLAQLLRGKAGTYYTEMEWARDHAQTYSITDYVDLGNLTDRLMTRIPENETEIHLALAMVRENVTSTVIAEDHGTGRAGSNGLSVYFPDYGTSPSYDRIDISREQGWDDFLSAHFARLDRPNAPPNVTVGSPLPGSVVGLEFMMVGTAEDADGEVAAIEVKFDRGPWTTASTGDAWSTNLSTERLAPGPHRVSVRARDDVGGYSREVQFQVMVQSRGLMASIDPGTGRMYPGGTLDTLLNVTTFGEEGGTVDLEVLSSPDGWTVDTPFTRTTIGPQSSSLGRLMVTVPPAETHGIHWVVLRAAMSDAELIQAFAVLIVNVTFQRPDLWVGPLVLDPPEPSVGQVVNVSFEVANIGLAAAKGFRVTLNETMELNGTERVVVVLDEQVDDLPVGETRILRATWNASLHTHVFAAVADPGVSVLDLDRSDNVRVTTITLEGHAVHLEVGNTLIETEPGAVETIEMTVSNVGNLVDILQLSVVESARGWNAVFNRSSIYIYPLDTAAVELYVRVPLGIPGGTEETVTVRLKSYHDTSKFEDVSVRLVYPETFGLAVSQDSTQGAVPPLGTVSFNVTIENSGNGFENYTLVYLRQTEHLFVSAVNDSLELAPGCETVVEVFVSGLGSPVGGQTFAVNLTVRSDDDPSTKASVVYRATVMRRFDITVESDLNLVEVVSGGGVTLNLSVTNQGNYQIMLEVHVLGPSELTSTGLADEGTVGAGDDGTFQVAVQVRPTALMGTYDLSLLVHEAGAMGNNTSVDVRVEVLRVDMSSISVGATPDGLLGPSGTWTFEVLLWNDGNHAETYVLELTGLIDAVDAVIVLPDGTTVPHDEGPAEVTLAAHAKANISIELGMEGSTEAGPEDLMVVVTATPANSTGDPPQAVVIVPLDIPERAEAGTPWEWIALAALSLAVVLSVLLVVLRRLRS